MCAEAEGYFLNFAPASASLKRDSFVSSKMGNYYTPARGTMEIILPGGHYQVSTCLVSQICRCVLVYPDLGLCRKTKMATITSLVKKLGSFFRRWKTSRRFCISRILRPTLPTTAFLGSSRYARRCFHPRRRSAHRWPSTSSSARHKTFF